MIDNINTILLYIFVILLLFCIMYILFYSDQDISFGDNLDSIENSIYIYNNNNHINNNNNNNNHKNNHKENFESLEVNDITYLIYNPPENKRKVSDKKTPNDSDNNYISSMLDSKQGWSASITDNTTITTNSASGFNQSRVWLEMDLGSVMYVAGVVTQGKGPGIKKDLNNDPVSNPESVTHYRVEYSNDGLVWIRIDDGRIYTGNTTSVYNGTNKKNNKIGNVFNTPLTTRFIRILPQRINNWTTMRAGILTVAPYYSEDDAQLYLQKLTDLNNYVISNQNSLVSILDTIKKAEGKARVNNSLLVKNITKLYYKEYLDYINKINAAVFNQSNKYINNKIKKIEN